MDRFQTVREVGYIADPATGWSTTPLKHAGYEAEFFNFEARREAELASQEDVLTVNVFDSVTMSDGGWAGVRTYAEVVLPDAATMAQYDTLELDLDMACGHPEYEACPEWDYLVYAYLCSDATEENAYTEQACQPYVAEVMGTCVRAGEDLKTECRSDDDCDSKAGLTTCEGYVEAVAADTLTCDCENPDETISQANQTCLEDGSGYDDCACSCGTELGRFITTYARPGRWIKDVSPFLSAMDEGGTQRIAFYTQQQYDISLDLRFRNTGKGDRPQAMEYLERRRLQQRLQQLHRPHHLHPPADATKVEIMAVISGHGFNNDSANCASSVTISTILP